MNKTTVYFPDELLLKKAKEMGLNISKISRDAVEAEVYGDNPAYLDALYEREKELLKHQQTKVENLDKKRKQARVIQQERKERLQQTSPETSIPYGKVKPPNPKPKNKDGDILVEG